MSTIFFKCFHFNNVHNFLKFSKSTISYNFQVHNLFSSPNIFLDFLSILVRLIPRLGRSCRLAGQLQIWSVTWYVWYAFILP